MATQTSDPTPRWFIYAVTGMLGFAFTTILVSMAWDSAIAARKRESSYELSALRQMVGHNVLVSNNVINNLTAFINSKPDLSRREFNTFASRLIEFYPFIDNIVYYSLVEQEQFAGSGVTNTVTDPASVGDKNRKDWHFPVLYETARETELFTEGYDIYADPRAVNVLNNLFTSGTSTIVSSAFTAGDSTAYAIYALLKDDSVATGNIAGIVSLFVSPEKFFGNLFLPEDLSLVLFSEYANIGRQLLYQKTGGQTANRGWIIAPVVETDQIQLPASSMKLEISKNIYWGDIEKGLIYIALLVGVGVTLLLIALIRARELQARELRERNIVIENTVRAQTRELALARDQAVKASVMKSEFLASMSHEIRTPLNAIIGMSELLSETRLSGDQKKYIGVFKRAGDTLLSLVNDILDLSKIEAHQLELESIPFSVLEVVEEAVEIYALKAAEKSVELHCHVEAGVNIYRIGDPGRLRQILLNLISNALKFTSEGEIIVNVGVDRESGGRGHLLFTVRDTGVGIPREKLEAIFESFTQADSSTTRKYGGTGLGLTISRSLAELMQGRIWVNSEPGQGSMFSFSVALPEDLNVTSNVINTCAGIADKQILVVAGNATLRSVLSEILADKKAVVTAVENAEQARAASKKTQFQMVIVDSSLSDAQGFRLVHELKSDAGSLLSVMMVNPTDLSESMDRMKEFGIDAYLVKPLKRRELLDTVDNCFVSRSDQAAIKELTAAKPEQGKDKCLLLVEDNPDNCLLIRAYLKNTAYELDEAENGAVAVDMFRRKKYDLVLMDVQMPVMDGHAATRAIRDHEAENHRPATPVIALTAHASREEIDKCKQAGCDTHLSKPIKKATLLEAINGFLTSPPLMGGD